VVGQLVKEFEELRVVYFLARGFRRIAALNQILMQLVLVTLLPRVV
jgi:hypothetical protein